METTKILGADILDIVFEGRNKTYGAYQLRKTYNLRLMYSLAVMLLPLTLITPIAPIPWGVASAAIVSSQPESLPCIKPYLAANYFILKSKRLKDIVLPINWHTILALYKPVTSTAHPPP